MVSPKPATMSVAPGGTAGSVALLSERLETGPCQAHQGYVFPVVGGPFAHVIFVHPMLGDGEGVIACEVGEIVGAEDDVERPAACRSLCGDEMPIRLLFDVIEAMRGRHQPVAGNRRASADKQKHPTGQAR